ncbi:MAG: cytochrome c maturation protein CcmE, partial [Flavitalea sp.]
MKKIHIVALVSIAVVIGVLISMMGDLSTYETLASARQKEGKTVTVIARLDKSVANPIEYDAAKNANYTS